MARDLVEIVKIRAATFIPDAWISRPREDESEPLVEFRGDDREFTPHAVNAERSRVEQEVVVDFARERLVEHARLGQSKERVTHPDGRQEVAVETGSASGVVCTDPVWDEEGVAFEMHASASNPLVTHPDPVDYALELAVGRDGTVECVGRHDGFPCFECYVQRDFGEFETLYRHDHREAGTTSAALAGPMDCEFERRV